MKKIFFIMAVCSLILFACKKTAEHTHDGNCTHDHSHEQTESTASQHTHGENCTHDHDQEVPAQESFTIEAEVN